MRENPIVPRSLCMKFPRSNVFVCNAKSVRSDPILQQVPSRFLLNFIFYGASHLISTLALLLVPPSFLPFLARACAPRNRSILGRGRMDAGGRRSRYLLPFHSVFEKNSDTEGVRVLNHLSEFRGKHLVSCLVSSIDGCSLWVLGPTLDL